MWSGRVRYELNIVVAKSKYSFSNLKDEEIADSCRYATIIKLVFAIPVHQLIITLLSYTTSVF